MMDACPRESEIAEAIQMGRWPFASSSELVAHASACAICRDVVAVASAIHDDYESARASVQLPSAGLVWWRAQLRTRQQIAETAGRPITYVQVAAGAVAAGMLFMLGGLLWPRLQASVVWIEALTRAVDTHQFWLPFALAFGVWLVLAPVLLLFVLSDD